MNKLQLILYSSKYHKEIAGFLQQAYVLRNSNLGLTKPNCCRNLKIFHLGTRLSGTRSSMSICHYVIDIRIIKQGINSKLTDEAAFECDRLSRWSCKILTYIEFITGKIHKFHKQFANALYST